MSLATYVRRMRGVGASEAAEDAALAAIVRSSQDAVIAKTIEGRITSWNAGAVRLYGYRHDDVLGENIEQMFPPEALVEERARHARVAAGVAESGFRCTRLRADGEAVEVVMSMSPVRDGAGEIIGIASISRPVSSREDDESRVAALLQAAPDAMICIDSSGLIITANTQAAEMFGYGRDELTGQPVEILVPQAARELHRRHRAAYFQAPVRRQMGAGLGVSALRRDGSTFAVEVSLAADTTSTPVTVIAAVRDVTRQRATEAAVRLSEAQFRQLAEHVDTVFILRQNDPFAYLYVSPAFERITGRRAEDFTSGRDKMFDLIHPDDRAKVEGAYLASSQRGMPAYSEHRIIRPDGAIRWVRTFAAPVLNLHGPVERSVVTMEDVTERVEATIAAQEAENAAKAANDAKTAFLGRMSHELRTPLNAILGFGQLLEADLTNSHQLESVQQIIKAGRHLHSLINEVLDITRIESGELTVSLEPIEAAPLMNETIQLLAPLAASSGITLTLEQSQPRLRVTADRQRLRQVLLNLLSNAIKYNHENGHVWLTCSADGPLVVISVRDDGRGIPPRMHSRVFTPFDRLDAEGSAVEGTGVGLAVTHALVALMGGIIEFVSEPGVGSTFTVTLPLTTSPEIDLVDEQAGPVGRPPQGQAQPSVLLYIEDNEPNVRLIQSLLRLRPHWRMLHAGTAGLGIDVARSQRVDLILLDLHLPDGSGFDVLQALDGESLAAGTPIVVLTADANTGIGDRLIEAGAARFMTKPLDIHLVLEVLDGVAAKK